MYLSEEKKLVYVHINKCGGNSVANYLRAVMPDLKRLEYDLYHRPLSYIPERFIEGGYTVLVTVRNPFDRLESIYSFRRMRARQYIEAGAPVPVNSRIALESSFGEWLERTLTTWHPRGLVVNRRLYATDYLQMEYLDKCPSNLVIIPIEKIEEELSRLLYSRFAFNVQQIQQIQFRQIANKSIRERVVWPTWLWHHVYAAEEPIIKRFYPHAFRAFVYSPI